MTNHEIAIELDRRAHLKLSEFKKPMGEGLTGLQEYLNGIVKNCDSWKDYLVEELNQILEDNNVSFKNEKEKEVLSSDIKPTMVSLLQEIIKP